MKFCKDCKHYQSEPGGDHFYGRCLHPSEKMVNPITGEDEYPFASVERKFNACGIAGTLFEQKADTASA